jgi:hypothetical protein
MTTQTTQIANCPITLMPFVDPVIDREGISYEREAITTWLMNHNVSPVSRQPLHLRDLVPNRSLQPQPQPVLEQEQEQEVFVKTSPVLSCTHNLAVISNPNVCDRLPVNICCVFDVSGSMCVNASEPIIDPLTNEIIEHDGKNVLDIVKHAILTVMGVLGPQDKLSLVAFSGSATPLTKLENMTEEAKLSHTIKLLETEPNGGTNIYSGLMSALSILDKSPNQSIILLFTDGEPNYSPVGGEALAIDNYYNQKPEEHLVKRNLPVIHTFGFGNNLDSEMLYDISKTCHGMYCFISESSMIGTIFVNAISNILSTYGSKAEITCEDGQIVPVGSLQYGQPRMARTPSKPSFLTFYKGTKSVEQVFDNVAVETDDITARLVVIKALDEIMDNCLVEKRVYSERHRKNIYKKFVDTPKATNVFNVATLSINRLEKSQYVKDLLCDFTVEIKDAIFEFYHTWGPHYIRSIKCAHENQICTNFKDPGVKHYGGKLFGDIKTVADTAFDCITPPASNIVIKKTKGRAPSAKEKYNDASVSCFAGWCEIERSDNVMTRIDKLSSGNIIKTENGWSTITCIVKTMCKDGKTDLVHFPNGLVITPTHPIKHNNEWILPSTIKDATETTCEAVYSFLLDRDHTMIINGVTCITFAHGRTEGILEHPFYGTNEVVLCLKKMIGWDVGLVNLKAGCIKADSNSVVTGLVQ